VCGWWRRRRRWWCYDCWSSWSSWSSWLSWWCGLVAVAIATAAATTAHPLLHVPVHSPLPIALPSHSHCRYCSSGCSCKLHSRPRRPAHSNRRSSQRNAAQRRALTSDKPARLRKASRTDCAAGRARLAARLSRSALLAAACALSMQRILQLSADDYLPAPCPQPAACSTAPLPQSASFAFALALAIALHCAAPAAPAASLRSAQRHGQSAAFLHVSLVCLSVYRSVCRPSVCLSSGVCPLCLSTCRRPPLSARALPGQRARARPSVSRARLSAGCLVGRRRTSIKSRPNHLLL
jgi:hypothetical protein